MKVSFVIANAYDVGGTVRTTFATAAELARRGHKVEIVSLYRLRAVPQIPCDKSVSLRVLVDSSASGLAALAARRGPAARAQRALRAFLEAKASRLMHPADERYFRFNKWTDLQLLRYLRSVDADVIVGTRPALNIAIARWVRPEVVRVGQEHLHLSRHRASLRRAIRIMYPKLDSVATLTNADAAAYLELLEGTSTRIDTIPNAAPSGGKQSTCTEKVVISAGRFMGQKGFDFLIDAYATVARKHPDWELRIFGDGDLRNELREQIDVLGLEDHVFLEGFTRKMRTEMQRSSIYAMSSRFEGFPMVLLEAMSIGLPAVSFDLANGPRDIISDGVDGRLVADRDPDALAAALCELIEDDARRTEMGAEARQKAKMFSIEAVGDEWEALFTELVAAKKLVRREGTKS